VIEASYRPALLRNLGVVGVYEHTTRQCGVNRFSTCMHERKQERRGGDNCRETFIEIPSPLHSPATWPRVRGRWLAFLFRLDRAQDPRAPFVAAFIHELVSEGRHHHLGGLVLTNNRRIDFRAGLEISGRRAAMILKGRCYRP
jgi:hypothetical protein